MLYYSRTKLPNFSYNTCQNFISHKARNIKVKFKLLFNLEFKIEIKVFGFKLNFISKGYRV
jgi:hypothetical protein